MAKRLNLVTGACGFSGSELVRQLLERGEKVIATDLPSAFDNPKTRTQLAARGIDFSDPKVKVIPADLTDAESLKPLFKEPVTHFFHTASLYDYSAKLETLRRINVDGFLNLVNLAVDAKLERFIHWSTCGVFGKPYRPSDRHGGNTPFAEDNPSPKNTPFEQDAPAGTHIVNDYSVTKFKQEQWAWKYHREKGLPLTVVRPAPLYGPGSDYGHGGIILTIHKGFLPVIPLDAKNYITTSVHNHDMAGFADYISRRDDAIGEDYNVVDDSIISYFDFLKYIALLLGRPMLPIPGVNLRLARPFAVQAAKTWQWLNEKFKVPRVRVFEVQSATYIGSSYWISNKKTKDWGYTYRYPDVHEGLRDTIQWFRQVGWIE